MLIRCNNTHVGKIKDYIGDEYYKCLYLYLDLIQYECEAENVKVWIQTQNANVVAVILKYYTGMHIYSKEHDYQKPEILELIENEKPAMICGEKQTILDIYDELKSKKYNIETGWVRGLKDAVLNVNEGVEKAQKQDFLNIAKLIYQDEDLGSSYDLESLTQQMYERNLQKFTRNYVIHKDEKVIAHASTGAENEKLAMLSYVITDPQYRGRGFAYQVCSNLCKDLIDEGKQIFLINYSQESTKLYDKLGFKICCEWGKLFLNLKEEGERNND